MAKKRIKRKAKKPVAYKKAVVNTKEPKVLNLFLGGVFLLVAAYLFLTQTDTTMLIFGGGIMLLLSIVCIYPEYKKQRK